MMLEISLWRSQQRTTTPQRPVVPKIPLPPGSMLWAQQHDEDDDISFMFVKKQIQNLLWLGFLVACSMKEMLLYETLIRNLGSCIFDLVARPGRNLAKTTPIGEANRTFLRETTFIVSQYHARFEHPNILTNCVNNMNMNCCIIYIFNNNSNNGVLHVPQSRFLQGLLGQVPKKQVQRLVNSSEKRHIFLKTTW